MDAVASALGAIGETVMEYSAVFLVVVVLILAFGPGLFELVRAIRFALAARHSYRAVPPREDEP